VFDQKGELPLLPFGNPIGFVPVSRGGIYIKYLSNKSIFGHLRLFLSFYFGMFNDIILEIQLFPLSTRPEQTLGTDFANQICNKSVFDRVVASLGGVEKVSFEKRF